MSLHVAVYISFAEAFLIEICCYPEILVKWMCFSGSMSAYILISIRIL